MRITRTWTISLPPMMSRAAERVALQEQRTKSELVREALRRYLAQRAQSHSIGIPDRLSHVGALTDFYRRRHSADQPSEMALRRDFRKIRRLHERLKHRLA